MNEREVCLNREKIKTKYGTLELKGDGFLTICADDSLIEISFSLEDAKELIQQIREYCEGDPYPFLFDYSDAIVTIPNEVREFIARHQELNKIKMAEAIITKSLASRLLINVFLAFNKPVKPVKAFNDINSAKKWLAQFI